MCVCAPNVICFLLGRQHKHLDEQKDTDEVEKALKIDCVRSGNTNIKYNIIFSSNSFVRLHLVNEQQSLQLYYNICVLCSQFERILLVRVSCVCVSIIYM